MKTSLSSFNIILKISKYFWAKYFGNLKNGQKKCPKIEIPETVLKKKHICDHN